MSAQVHSVPGQTVSRRKAFLEWKSIAMAKHPVNYLLHVGVMLTIAKVFIILFLFVRIGNILATFEINSMLCFQLSVQVYSLYGQTEGKRKNFLEVCKKGSL